MLGCLIALAVFLTGFAFEGSFDWFEIGYVYPQHHYPRLVQSGANLPRLLSDSPYHWQITDAVNLPHLPAITMRTFLIWLYTIMMVMCGIGASLHARRRSARFLLAIATPWVLLFTIMPQMHERYLVWAAVVTCVGFGLGPGYALLALVTTWLAFFNMAGVMMWRDPTSLPTLTAVMKGMNPGIVWGLMMLAAIYLYLAVVPFSRPRPLMIPVD